MPAALALVAPVPPSWATGWTVTVTYDPEAAPERCYSAELYDAPYQQIQADIVARAYGATAREAMSKLHAVPMRRAS